MVENNTGKHLTVCRGGRGREALFVARKKAVSIEEVEEIRDWVVKEHEDEPGNNVWRKRKVEHGRSGEGVAAGWKRMSKLAVEKIGCRWRLC